MPFQIGGQCKPIDNGFKQVQTAYLALISNLDNLVQPMLMLMLIRLLERPGLLSNACQFDLRQINLISMLINGDV